MGTIGEVQMNNVLISLKMLHPTLQDGRIHIDVMAEEPSQRGVLLQSLSKITKRGLCFKRILNFHLNRKSVGERSPLKGLIGRGKMGHAQITTAMTLGSINSIPPSWRQTTRGGGGLPSHLQCYQDLSLLQIFRQCLPAHMVDGCPSQAEKCDGVIVDQSRSESIPLLKSWIEDGGTGKMKGDDGVRTLNERSPLINDGPRFRCELHMLQQQAEKEKMVVVKSEVTKIVIKPS